jgi:predicted phosphodiesterase
MRASEGQLMKLLALSDVHNNLVVARKMRAQERNVFDAIVVGGDLGGNAAVELFGVLKTFKCPIMYVYGNWDDGLRYDQSFGKSAHLLHMNVVEHERFAFVGYSGCQANWGHNPIALKILGETPATRVSVSADIEKVFLEYRHKKAEIERMHERRVARLNRPAMTRRSKLYKQQLKLLAEKQESEIAEAKKPLQLVVSTQLRAERTDLIKMRELKQEVLRLNREELLKAIQESGVSHDRLITVTHERTPWKYIGHSSLHVFGHRHGFSDHLYKGTRYINVSALDGAITARPSHLRKWSYDDCRNINGGNYVIIEIGSTGNIVAKSVALPSEYERWTPINDGLIEGIPCIPEEQIYMR